MGNSCCNAHGGDKVLNIPVDAPPNEENAANEAETVADAYGVGAASHDEAYGAADNMADASKVSAKAAPEEAHPPVEGEDAPRRLSFVLERKPEDSIGLNLDAVDETAPFVDDVLVGSVRDWNENKPKEQQLRIYDRIIEVNGVTGNTNAILAAMKASPCWHMVVQRPMQMQVTVSADKAISLGLDLKYSPNGRSLLIDEVLADGGIKKWNDEHSDKQVKAFDRVIQINGRIGTAKELLESAANKTCLELVILRYT